MEIKDRIKNISEYFKEMRISTMNDGSKVIYIVVTFPLGWEIEDGLEERFGITVGKGKLQSEYYFCTNIENGEKVLFDAIEYNIERMKEAIERSDLLFKKVSELKMLFEDDNVTISQLRGLTFTYGDKVADSIISVKKDNKELKEEIKKDKTEGKNE